MAHVAVLARKCHTRGALPAVVEVADWPATAAVLAVMLVWVNEKAIFCSDFSRVVFDGLL